MSPLPPTYRPLNYLVPTMRKLVMALSSIRGNLY